MHQKKLLYVYEERIPIELQRMIIKKIKSEKFYLKKMTYKTPLFKQKKLFRWCDAVFFAPGRNVNNDVIKEAKNCKIFIFPCFTVSVAANKISIRETSVAKPKPRPVRPKNCCSMGAVVTKTTAMS